MSVDYRELVEFRDNLKKVDKQREEIIEACAKELAARLLRKVIKRTKPGVYPKSSGKRGGTLRRGWTGGQNAANVLPYLEVHYLFGQYVINVENPVPYASYVEYGHRTRGGKSWVPGKFMMTISAEEVERDAPKILERKLAKMLGDAIG